MVCGMKSYGSQRYGTEVWVMVHFDGFAMVDAIKGLNKGHALWRARQNWTDAELISVIG